MRRTARRRTFDPTVIPEGVLGTRRHLRRRWLVLAGIAALLAILGVAAVVAARPRPGTDVRRYLGEFVPVPAIDGRLKFETLLGLRDGSILLVGNSMPGLERNSVVVDPATGVARRLGRPQVGRYGPVAIELADGRVLILGSDSRVAVTTDATSYVPLPPTAELLDPVRGGSTLVGPLHTPRIGFSAVLLADGRVLIAGGRALDGTLPVRDAELFDPSTGSFTPTGQMVQAHADPVLVALPDGRAALRDGPFLEVFDPVTTSFAMPPGVIEDDGRLLVATAGGQLIAVGGTCTEIPRNWPGVAAEKRGQTPADPNQDPVPVSLVDPGTGATRRLSDLPHCAGTATALADGTLFVTGWWTETRLKDTQRGRVAVRDLRTWSGIYDLRTGITRATPAPPGGRYMTVVPLGDGRVLMTDGERTEILQ